MEQAKMNYVDDRAIQKKFFKNGQNRVLTRPR